MAMISPWPNFAPYMLQFHIVKKIKLLSTIIGQLPDSNSINLFHVNIWTWKCCVIILTHFTSNGITSSKIKIYHKYVIAAQF